MFWTSSKSIAGRIENHDPSKARTEDAIPRDMKEQILQGLFRQMKKHGRLSEWEIGAVVPSEEAGIEWTEH